MVEGADAASLPGGLGRGGPKDLATGGRIGELPPGMDVEVAEARWLRLDDAPRLLAYRGERNMAQRAREKLADDPL